MEEDKATARIEIVLDQKTGEAKYDFHGLSHEEAQRVLLFVLYDNHKYVVAELQGRHHHHHGEDEVGHDHQ